jgi:hypothetical protein
VTSHSASLGIFFIYHIVETVNSPGVVCAGNFHVIFEIDVVAVSILDISLFAMYHHLTNHHKNSFKG